MGETAIVCDCHQWDPGSRLLRITSPSPLYTNEEMEAQKGDETSYSQES